MAIDFPASPTNGQLFSPGTGVVYQWNAAGGLWLQYGTGTNNAIISTTPPSNPINGTIWWSPDTGQAYIYYQESGTASPSSQWVPLCPAPNIYGTTGWRSLSRIVTTAGQTNVDLYPFPADINDIEVRFDCIPAVNGGNLLLRFFDSTGTIDAANYSHGNYYDYSGGTQGGTVTWYSNFSNTQSGIVINLYTSGWGVSSTNVHGIQGRLAIPDVQNTTRRKTATWQAQMVEQTNTNVGLLSGFGYRTPAGAITGLRFLFDNGAFATGSVINFMGSP